MGERTTDFTAGAESRRVFLKRAATAAAAVAVTNPFKTPVYGQNQAPSAGRVIGANDRIVVGYVGLGGQGTNAHLVFSKQNLAANNIAQAAVCDVFKKRADAAKAIAGGDCQTYEDYRKVLDRKDIDAVFVATVDHWHAGISIDALNAGKHVYVEKAMTRYLDEAFAMLDTVKKTGKVLQVGSQGCSAAGWHKAASLIKEGKVGQLVWGQGYYNRNNPKGEWNYTIDPDAKPDTINWEQWLGPVKKKVPFNADEFFRWRKYYRYCGGLLSDLMPHRLHPLVLATGNPEFPSRVVCIGTKNVHSDKNTPGTPERDVAENMTIVAEFPSGFSLVVGSSSVNEKSPGFAIYGHKATLNLGTAGDRVQLDPERPFSDEIDPEDFAGLKPTEAVPEHHKNWFECIRTNKQPNANIDLAVKVQTIISLAEISDRMKVAALFDEKTRKVSTGDGREIKPFSYSTEPTAA